MDRQQLKDEIEFALTGGVVSLELNDTAIDKLINSCLREIQRYYDTPILATIPYKKCIDCKELNPSYVVNVFRTTGQGNTQDDNKSSTVDPMMAAQWQLLQGQGNMALFNDYTYNYASWNLLNQIRNTSQTDLAFTYDTNTQLLYINVNSGIPKNITIAYIPHLLTTEQIKQDYWIDNLTKLCIAKAKIILGRIRTRYVQSNALYTMDGETMLNEGTTEYNSLIEYLQTNCNLLLPID